MTMPSVTLIYCPFPNREAAQTTARALLTEKLVACCNLLPGAESHYWWEGKLETAGEVVMIAKTTADYASRATRRIGELHPYECPAILTFAVESTGQYAQWVSANLGPT